MSQILQKGREPALGKTDSIFPTISVARVRSLLTRVQTIDYVIPSIHTFLEDTKMLEPCARIMKKLLPAACRTSIFQEFGRLHNGQTSWSLQMSEASCCRKEESSSDKAHRNAYRQLWLFAIRHFPEMIGQPLRKDPPRARTPLLGVELVWWYRITALAEACGYAELDKTYHRGEEADYKMAQTFLQQVRPPQLYGTSTDTGTSVQQVVDLIGRDHPLLPHDTEGVGPETAMDVYGVPCGPDITSRCGVPFERAFRKDQGALFLEYIDQRVQQGRQECIGSFMVKQNTFHRFFGFSEGPHESHSQNWLRSEPLRHNSINMDEFTSTRPPDISSAEADMEILPQEEILFTSNPPLAQADLNPPTSQEAVLPAPTAPVVDLQAAVLHSPTDLVVDRAEALRIFEGRNQWRDPDYIVILRQESTDAFKVFTFNRHDREGISKILPPAGQHEYLVSDEYLLSDENRSKRIKLTNPRTIPDENVVIIGYHGMRMEYEETPEEL